MGRKHNDRVARVTSDNKVYWYENAKEASQQCNIPYGTLVVACNGATVKYLDRLGWRFYFEKDAPEWATEWAKGELVERATESLESQLSAAKLKLETALGDTKITESSIMANGRVIETISSLRELILKVIDTSLTLHKEGQDVLEDTLIHNKEQVELNQWKVEELTTKVKKQG